MKFRGLLAGLLALALIIAPVHAQDGQGTSPLSIPKGGTGASTASGARTNLGLGSIATQNANSVAITGGSITGLPAPSNPSDAARKQDVDNATGGLTILAPSALATAAVLPNTPTYSNGASGVGATLTAGSNTTLTVDGTAAPLNTVVLVKTQASAFQNGIYTVTTAGGGVPWVLTRATYIDQAAEMKAGSYTFITAGSTNINSAWTLQTAVTTVGTDPLNFVLFSAAGVSSVAITGGTGTVATGTCSGSNINCAINPIQAEVKGRLTLASATPVMNATSCSGAQCSAQQTLYFAPDGGYTAPVYDGTQQRLFPFTCAGSNGCTSPSSATDAIGVSLSLAGSANWAANSCFDVFYAYVSGTLYFGTGPAWSTCIGSLGTPARGYSLAKYNGVPVNAATMTLRYGASSTISVPANQASYLGTVLTNASTAGQIDYVLGTSATNGGGARIGVWNYWDRKNFSTTVQAAVAQTYSYSAAVAYRPCIFSTTFQITVVIGLAEDPLVFTNQLYGSSLTQNATAGGGLLMDNNADITTAPPYLDVSGDVINPTAAWGPATPFIKKTYGIDKGLIGSHYFQCYLGADPGTTKYYWGNGVGDFTLDWRN